MNCPQESSAWAGRYAAHLLRTLAVLLPSAADLPLPAAPTAAEDVHPALAWARSGAMALTGMADGPPQLCPLPLATGIDGVARALSAVLQSAGGRWQGALPGVETLGERAALNGLQRRGQISAGGACRLLPVADGWLAISLPRADDWHLIAAWLECDSASETGTEACWQRLAGLLRRRPLAALIDRARLLGLAVAAIENVEDVEDAWPGTTPAAWYQRQPVVAATPQPQPSAFAAPLVVDLSSLWAGPLCSHLLQLTGARVIKVESRQRPDGARRGEAAFFDLLNHGKASVALDFSSPQDLRRLRELLLRADIVIEAARPRALRQLGIVAEDIIVANPGLSWVAISGHGRNEPQADWIAYGDDAGVAAGLSGLMLRLTGAPLFCGDAIADPLTGWHATLAALAAHVSGGGQLISLALSDVVRHCAQFGLPATPADLQRRWQRWQARLVAEGITAANVPLPSPRHAPVAARPLGADTDAILQELGIA
ncbi:MAG: CoA transferase [Sterolibacterium sp.]|nr:CoA transferase [Sterolibacterium sp.]